MIFVAHPLPSSPLLLRTLLRKRWKCWGVSAVDGSLDDAADPGLLFLGEAQNRLCDGVHVSLVLHVNPDDILPLLISALVCLFKFNDVLYCNLGDRWRDRAGCFNFMMIQEINLNLPLPLVHLFAVPWQMQ